MEGFGFDGFGDESNNGKGSGDHGNRNRKGSSDYTSQWEYIIAGFNEGGSDSWDPQYGFYDKSQYPDGANWVRLAEVRVEEKPKYKDFSMSETALNIGGLLYGFGENIIASKKGGYWLGIDGKYYTKMAGRGPNQWTGARSAAFRDSRLFKIAGRATFFVGAFISGYEGVEQFKSGDYIGVSKSGLDIGMGAISTYGGPFGLAVGGVYFTIDATIGWDNAMQSQESIIIQNQSIHGSGWSYYGNGGVK